MVINPSIFKAYDIRGVYPSDINGENTPLIITAIYRFFTSRLKKSPLSVVLGRDMRISSPSLYEIAKKALLAEGATVIDTGLVSTPTFYFAVFHYQYDCGIQISASHNPKEYNGIKFAVREDHKIVKIGKNTGIDEVRKIALSETLTERNLKGSRILHPNVIDDEISFVTKNFDMGGITPFKVVADPANAMGALYLEKLFERIPGKLIKMNFDLDGTFPAHQPDPLQFETLHNLQNKVIEEKADLGIAPDGDGDRVFFIDEKGGIIPATLITSLITKEILAKSPGETVLVDVRSIGNVRNICKKHGGKVSVSHVGHALITEQLNKENAIFAGESSGHFYFRDMGGAESSVRAILYVLDTMSRTRKPISEILSSLQTWYESGEINFALSDKSAAQSLLESIEKKYPDGEVSWLDGLSVDYRIWRFNIRTSNTEPLLRLNVEAEDETVLKTNLEKILSELKETGAKRK
ncbi:phosphomannomutase/phosphoglucomutase [Candidatus Roizmanbacteria bacterium]|nr:phosphomannomutase/phosphoglucomutase [Candidatus Roizmanbacteria bacterium]